jgi:hypothetical protein
MSFPRFVTCALCAVLLCACAPQANVPQVGAASVDAEAKYQQTLVLRDSVDKMDRLARVSWNILAANAELCEDKVTRGVGLSFLELDDYAKDKREFVKEVLGISWRPTVFQAPPGSPGDIAGLRRGDVVVSIAGLKPENKKQAREVLEAALEKSGDIPIQVERAGQAMAFVMHPVALCDYPVVRSQDKEINAYADGAKIVVNQGMLKFVRSDDELAGILGHELAHNVRKHIRDMQVNSTLGRLLIDLPVAVFTGVNPNLGWQLGRNMYSQEYEFEADYVGLYFTARAGYDTRSVAEIWRRMAVENPKAITMGTTHPSTSKRFVALDAGGAEIAAKRKAGKPLRPELKGEPQPAETPAAPAAMTSSGDPKEMEISLPEVEAQ